MRFVQFYSKDHRRLRWERFSPTLLIRVITIVEFVLTGAILGLEFWSMIINIKYSFFFIGFIATVFFIITCLSTLFVGCCCRKSIGCATYASMVHILSIAASSILLFYDILFLRNSHKCLWPKNLCNQGLTNLNMFGIALSASNEIHWLKFTLLKIQIGCAAAMIATCVVYMVIYIYTCARVYAKNTVADPHTVIELGRIQAPPPPHWPDPPRELPPASEF